ncbi:MAG: IS5/IS1182 family transposase, partial [Candidatus Micrarchaeaceae archaeon]
SSITERGIGIKKFYGDGAFDQSSMFNKLQLLHIKPVVKIRKNASTDYYNGSKYRRRIVREYKNMGYKRWSSLNNYGMRWPGTEGIFSAVKRKFGENTVSRSEEGLLTEGYQRFWAYDEMKEYGEVHTLNKGP